MKYLKVESTENLKELLRAGNTEFFIMLNGGLRSSKIITMSKDEQTFCIENEIDGSEEELSESEIWFFSNIGKAIDKGAFFMYQYEKVK